MLWIAEGLDALSTGIRRHLCVQDHARRLSDDYVKASRWAANARKWEASTGKTKIWIGTISPGWMTGDRAARPTSAWPARPHKKERSDGAFYRATYNAAIASSPDWIWINSFNEWVEGSYIEPSEKYGDQAMQLTREFARQFKGQ